MTLSGRVPASHSVPASLLLLLRRGDGERDCELLASRAGGSDRCRRPRVLRAVALRRGGVHSERRAAESVRLLRDARVGASDPPRVCLRDRRRAGDGVRLRGVAGRVGGDQRRDGGEHVLKDAVEQGPAARAADRRGHVLRGAQADLPAQPLPRRFLRGDGGGAPPEGEVGCWDSLPDC